MRARDLLLTARELVERDSKRPRQSNLRRAMSTAYYAAFHFIARSCADLLIAKNRNSRSNHAWRQDYRALDHGPAKNACADSAVISRFPAAIQDFANLFKEMQEKRHDADYDPFAKFKKSQVSTDIARIEEAIRKFERASPKDKTAFCAFLLLKKR